MRSLLAALLIASAAIAVVPVPAFGQFADSAPISITLFPEYPRPYDTVTVTPRSTLINLASSEVTISANGVVIEEGSGSRSTTVVMGAPGSSTTIRITAVFGGTSYSSEITVRPADVALVLESQTTTHPLFEGGSLVAPQGRVRVIAMPEFRLSNGARVPASSLSYTWRLGNRILTEESGIGRFVLEASAPVRYRNADVSVTVTTQDDSMAGFAEIKVAPASPALYVYRTDPLLGLDLAHAMTGTFTMSSEEETFRAIPFHFKEEPSLSWTLNTGNAGSEDSLTVRTTSNNAGTASIGVTAAEPEGESARTSFSIDFMAKSGGFFGF